MNSSDPIGKTRSGKSIYPNFEHPTHADFKPHEDDDAATLHVDIMERLRSEEKAATDSEHKQTLRTQRQFHNEQARWHIKRWKKAIIRPWFIIRPIRVIWKQWNIAVFAMLLSRIVTGEK